MKNLLLLGCLLATAPAGPVSAVLSDTPAERAARVTIIRDLYGVPHVFAPTDPDCVFGFMYARAEDEFHRIERSVIGMVGRSAELLGQAGLGIDLLVHAYDIPGRAEAEYEHLDPKVQALCIAAAEGLNYFLETHPEVEPALIREFEPWHFLAQGYGMHLAPVSLVRL